MRVIGKIGSLFQLNQEGGEILIERDVERTLIRAARKGGGLCLKFVSPGWAGAPDRLCLFPEGRGIFVELKRPGMTPRPLQARRAEQLKRLGFEVGLIDSKEEVEKFMAKVGGGAVDGP